MIATLNGCVKLTYSTDESEVIKLWEPVSSCTLETTFDKHGVVLEQHLLKISGQQQLDKHVSEFLKSIDISQTSTAEFSEVVLNKRCPKCGSLPLKRHTEKLDGRVPVMPIYRCSSCNQKSYHLGNTYLEFLVNNNNNLFSAKERAEQQADRQAFMRELQAYIIRVFATKHILGIKE